MDIIVDNFVDSIELNKTYLGDCLDIMDTIPDHCVDMIFSDLPYGTTRCSWDSIINLEKLWVQYKRIINRMGRFCFSLKPHLTRF